MENSKKTWVIDGYTWLHCPVCGTEVMDYDICDVCGWQNTGIINIDGGPNKIGCSTNPVGEKSPTGFFTCKKEKSEL